MRLSVNVWTPELDAFQAEPFQKRDFKRYLVNHDPEELIEESRNAWRCIGKIYWTIGIQTLQCNLLYGLKLNPGRYYASYSGCKKMQVLEIANDEPWSIIFVSSSTSDFSNVCFKVSYFSNIAYVSHQVGDFFIFLFFYLTLLIWFAVNATLPVVTPPTLRCKYFQVASKHFLCIEGEWYTFNLDCVTWHWLTSIECFCNKFETIQWKKPRKWLISTCI